MKYRPESFGGIIASEDPPFLAFVDQDYMRSCGVDDAEEWQRSTYHLSAPIEVHFSRTNRCHGGCDYCYMDSKPNAEDELTTTAAKAVLSRLAEMGVFHVALGGGEALLCDDIIEIANYARQLNIVPNLTTTAEYVNNTDPSQLKVFGQVNLSIDSIKESHFRAFDRTSCETAIKSLVENGLKVGINCVVSRRNFAELDSLVSFAKQHSISEVEFLRLKPVGRARSIYQQEKLTLEQGKCLFDKLLELQDNYGLTLKIDCSFVPMLCWTKPDIRTLRLLALNGCEAGNYLVSVAADGAVAGCSFLKSEDLDVEKLQQHWNNIFQKYRLWQINAIEPCKSCEFLNICKGGCHAVADAITGDIANPDPDCPIVVEYNFSKLDK